MFFTYWQKIWIAVFKDNILNCFDKGAENYHHIKVIDSIEYPLVCFEMMIMIFVLAEAYSYHSYVINRRNCGSITYIIADILHVFRSELRLLNPNKIIFRGEAEKQEIEMMSVSNTSS